MRRLVELRMHGVAGARMGQAEVEQRRGGERGAAPRQRDARRGEAAQLRPRLARVRGHAGRQRADTARAAARGSRQVRGGAAVDQALAREPGLELRRRAAAEQIAHGERVVERRALIAEHDVVGAGHAHDEVARRRRPAA